VATLAVTAGLFGFILMADNGGQFYATAGEAAHTVGGP
jgi:hypothetical protein